jgi:putative oxidoreductase
MDAAVPYVLTLGRLLMALIFVREGFHTLSTRTTIATSLKNRGVPFAGILVWASVVIEILGGLMFIGGFLTRWVALVLFFYTMILALMFHAYWAVPAATRRTESLFFFIHLAMMGGMLYVAAFGAGPCSIDGLLGR